MNQETETEERKQARMVREFIRRQWEEENDREAWRQLEAQERVQALILLAFFVAAALVVGFSIYAARGVTP